MNRMDRIFGCDGGSPSPQPSPIKGGGTCLGSQKWDGNGIAYGVSAASGDRRAGRRASNIRHIAIACTAAAKRIRM